MRILAHADPDSPEAVPWDAATRHATPEAWGLMTNAVSPPGLRPPACDRTQCVHVPRGTAAQVVARVEAGQRVTWSLRVSEGEARMAAAFRADRGALERALLRAVKVPAAAPAARVLGPGDRGDDEEQLRSLRARLAEAERRAAELQRTVLERDTAHEAIRSEHKRELRAARAEIDRGAQNTLRSERARARLRERLREAEAPKKMGTARAESVSRAAPAKRTTVAPAKKTTVRRATRSLGCCR